MNVNAIVMVNPENNKLQKLDMNSDLNADMVIDEIIAKIIHNDILSELKDKAQGIKEYISDLESAL